MVGRRWAGGRSGSAAAVGAAAARCPPGQVHTSVNMSMVWSSRILAVFCCCLNSLHGKGSAGWCDACAGWRAALLRSAPWLPFSVPSALGLAVPLMKGCANQPCTQAFVLHCETLPGGAVVEDGIQLLLELGAQNWPGSSQHAAQHVTGKFGTLRGVHAQIP